jgi:Ras family protein T1
LKPKCLEALKRIFRISDVDKDGLLNAHELNQFQVSTQLSPALHRHSRQLEADYRSSVRVQQKCFSTPLQSQELEGILALIRNFDPALVLPIPTYPYSTPSTPLLDNHPAFPSSSSSSHFPMSPPAEGITETGFLLLHTLFIQQGRNETTWTVLRKFGYGEGLDLREDFLSPK